jgi:hypothetical protein
MDGVFKEIVFPELVNDVREIFWNHIDKLGFQDKPIMKSEGIFGVNDIDHPAFRPISLLRKKYTFLDPNMLVFKLRPDFATQIHMDGHPNNGRIKQRPVSINIPISGCNKYGITEFYSNSETDFYLEERFNVRVLKTDVAPIKTYDYALLDNPIITNPQVPHRINNIANPEHRITVSWTVNISWTWEDTMKYFQNKIAKMH